MGGKRTSHKVPSCHNATVEGPDCLPPTAAVSGSFSWSNPNFRFSALFLMDPAILDSTLSAPFDIRLLLCGVSSMGSRKTLHIAVALGSKARPRRFVDSAPACTCCSELDVGKALEALNMVRGVITTCVCARAALSRFVTDAGLGFLRSSKLPSLPSLQDGSQSDCSLSVFSESSVESAPSNSSGSMSFRRLHLVAFFFSITAGLMPHGCFFGDRYQLSEL